MPEPDLNSPGAVWDASADRYVDFVGTELGAATGAPSAHLGQIPSGFRNKSAPEVGIADCELAMLEQ